MKILFLIRSLELGGAERQMIILARALRLRGHQVGVVMFYGGGPLTGELRDAGIEPVVLDKRGRWDVLPFLRRLVGEIRRQRPDVVHSYLTVPNVLLAAVAPFLPPCRIIWGVRASNMPWERYDWLARVNWKLECLLSRQVDRIIVNSNAGRDYAVANGFPAGKTIVIPNGVDTSRFRPDPECRRLQRVRLGLREGEVAVGLVARVDPVKDYETFLHAAALLHAENPTMRFLCVGGGEPQYEQELKALSAALGLEAAVSWLGALDDMPSLYNALELLCSSSVSEGFSNTIVEAMACGVPCAATDVGDSAFILGDPEFVARPQDPAGLAAAITRVWQKHPDAANLRNRVVKLFSIENLVTATEAVLEQGS